MKHLISLGLKYVRRQKLRTLLTFLCVTLSVFILSTFGAYCGTLHQTLINQEISTDGSWEADVTNWLKMSPDPKKAMEQIKNNVSVSDYLFSCGEYPGESHMTRVNGSSAVVFYEFSDGRTTRRLSRVSSRCMEGNSDLLKRTTSGGVQAVNINGREGIYMPFWVRDLGYSEGDTIEFTLRRITGEYDNTSPVIKDIRAELEEQYGSPLAADDPETQELSHEESKKICKQSLYRLLEISGCNFSDMPVHIKETGKTYRYSFKIAGFTTSQSSNADNDLYIPVFGSQESILGDLVKENGYTTNNAFICLDKSLEFDDALELLFNEIDTNAEFYTDTIKHGKLLEYQFRSADAIASLAVFIAGLTVIMLLFWAVARFVIDNAFEISAKERSTQYAALRIMGASKGQIAAVVLTEAVFYTVTAVPVGTFIAYLLCALSVKRLRSLGFPSFEFTVNLPVTALVIALCVIAIFISAYTSSMWATRKLSPSEALNFGKPQSSKVKLRKHRSKLKLSSKRFIKRYTKKNIMRSKSRFIIASITMTIGVTLFMIAVLAGIFVTIGRRALEEDLGYDCDFTIMYENSTVLSEAQQTFENNDLFSAAYLSVNMGYPVPSDQEIADKLNSHLPEPLYKLSNANTEAEGEKYIGSLRVVGISRGRYDSFFKDKLGMTYDEFAASNAGIMFYSVYGTGMSSKFDDDTGKYEKKFEPSLKKYPEPEIVTMRSMMKIEKFNIIADMCDDLDHFRYSGRLLYAVDSDFVKSSGAALHIELLVNGMESYEGAKALVDNFTADYSPSYMEENFIYQTGFRSFVGAIARMILELVAAVWLVGILSMINSITTSVLNRSRELMMLRSVGMTRKQLSMTVFQESLMFSSVSSIAGSVIAIGIFWLFVLSAGVSPVLILTSVGSVIGAAALIVLINVLIAAIAAVPGIRNLARAEALARAE